MGRALVFAGQGSQRKGMMLSIIPSNKFLWHRVESFVRDKYSFSITEVIRDNPTDLVVSPSMFVESGKTPSIATRCHDDSGLLNNNIFTQPAIIFSHCMAMESLRKEAESFEYVCGHSLGELSALAFLGVLDTETVVDIAIRRGVLMDYAVALGSTRRRKSRLFACNAIRSQLFCFGENLDGTLAQLIEAIAKEWSGTTSWIEAVNYNVPLSQIVVAGDDLALATLGRCLDPQFRADISEGQLLDVSTLVQKVVKLMQRDVHNPIPMPVDKASFVPGSFRKFHRSQLFFKMMETMDDGWTTAPEELAPFVTDNAVEGLKKRSWFVPLLAEIPFHSSALRRSTDMFYTDLLQMLPSSEKVSSRLSLPAPKWVTNLTGTVFDTSIRFREEAAEALSAMNVGEIPRNGKYESSIHVLQQACQGGSERELLAAVLASQVSHAVQWVKCMDTIVERGGCRSIVEVAARSTLKGLFYNTYHSKESPLTLRDDSTPLRDDLIVDVITL